jgi:hypothetical protein
MNQLVPIDLSQSPTNESNQNAVDLDPTGPMGFSRYFIV